MGEVVLGQADLVHLAKENQQVMKGKFSCFSPMKTDASLLF